MFFLPISTKRKIAATEKTLEPTTGHGAVVSEVPSMTMKKAPKASPAIRASTTNMPLMLACSPGVQETKNIAKSPTNTPITC